MEQERVKRDICFKCRAQGHWAINCPYTPNSKKRSDGQYVSPSTQAKWPAYQCPCGAGPCAVRTSRTDNNPNRDFFTCPGKSGDKCNFFEWCDQANFDAKQDVTLVPYPKCTCGAGKCNLFTVKKEGKNKGRKFFVCPVKQGQGACDFFKWHDDILKKAKTDDCIEEEKHLASFQQTSDSKQETKVGNADQTIDGNGNEVEKTISHGSAEIGVLNSSIDSLVTKMRKLKVTTIAIEPDKCYRCGMEGHLTRDCTKPVTKCKSLCYKCGGVGHWLNACPNSAP